MVFFSSGGYFDPAEKLFMLIWEAVPSMTINNWQDKPPKGTKYVPDLLAGDARGGALHSSREVLLNAFVHDTVMQLLVARLRR
jgi:hypothetical protein